MKFTTSTLLYLFMQAVGTTLAAPLAENSHSSVGLVPRQENPNKKVLYQGAPGTGNIEVQYGDGKLNYGNRVPSSALDVIRENCLDIGCEPNRAYPFTSSVVQGGLLGEKSFEVTVEGNFNAGNDPKTKSGTKSELLDIAKVAFQQVYNAGVATWQPAVEYISKQCPASQTFGCLSKEVSTIEQWESISHVVVQIGQYFINITIKMVDEDTGKGICEAMAAASAGLGLQSAVAGFAGGLIASACTVIQASSE